MNSIKKTYLVLVIAVMLIALNSCQQPGGNKSGSEYMPDMAHSIAYEANTYSYYYNNTWGSKDDYHEMAQPRKPVAGTIARGAVGEAINISSTNAIKVPANGATPYYYPNTEEGRAQAMAEIIMNPFPITEKGLAEGKELYNIYCGICHGEKGDGAGYLVRDPDPAKGDAGGKYPVQPANFLLEEFVAASNGRYYHAIHQGRNLMGSYKDKLSYEERWQVIHYIRSLQAKDLKLTYDQMENTLNQTATPAGEMVADASEMMGEAGHDDGMHEGETNNHSEDNHNDEHH